MTIQSDIVIIGAGIAGASAAAALSDYANVIVLEQEAHPGYHSTGRSAATWAPYYGPDVIQLLTALSKSTLTSPPTNLGSAGFTGARGEMMLGRKGDGAEIERHKEFGLLPLTIKEALQLAPLLRQDTITDVLYTDNLLSIDVDALHQAYIKKLKTLGGEIHCNSEVSSLRYNNDTWQVHTTKATYSAPIVINAAGAWAGKVGQMAGALLIEFQPKRRSAALVPFAQNANMANWPMIFGAGETFYCTPFGNGMMISPADETVVEPCDVWPEDLDIATGIDLFQQCIDYDIQSVTHQWAGLRTFAPDGKPVVGFDPTIKGFFWLAGQGGYGIQTSPAISEFCRAIIFPESRDKMHTQMTDKAIHSLDESLSPFRFSPSRYASSSSDSSNSD